MAAVIASSARQGTGPLDIVQRLWIFIAASISLHALMLAYSPGGSDGLMRELRSGATLHAVLAPPPAVNAVQDEPPLEQSQDPGARQAAATVTEPAPADATRPRAGAQGPDLPLPEKWYTAPELAVLAEPIEVVKLAYPDEFAGSTIIANVRVRLFVDERGTVQKIELVQSGPDPAFDAAAIRQWQGVRFKPGIRDGIAVKSQKLLELEFLPF